MQVDNAGVIKRFYSAFQRRDGAAMAACYHPEVRFSDPVFPDLHGARAAAMWKMLCERGTDLRIEYRDVVAEDNRGSAHWDATYTFSATGRKVLNRIDASFEFRDGLISRHTDRFDFYRWARQALGAKGVLLGWLPPVQAKVRSMAAKSLDEYMTRGG